MKASTTRRHAATMEGETERDSLVNDILDATGLGASRSAYLVLNTTTDPRHAGFSASYTTPVTGGKLGRIDLDSITPLLVASKVAGGACGMLPDSLNCTGGKERV